jgi:hypothetical protein
MRRTLSFRAFPLVFVFMLAMTFTGFAQVVANDEITTADLSNAHANSTQVTPRGHTNGQAHARFGIPNIDSLVNFNDQFFTQGFDSNGNPNRHWYYNMVGNPPSHKGTTVINAPIVPVSLDLLNFDGTVRFHMDVTPFIQPVLDSPVFTNANYSSSSVPTQISDAVQRAEFFNVAQPDWHTILKPVVKPGRTMRVPRGTYAFARNADGTCCSFVEIEVNTFVNLLFPATADDTTTPIGAAEHAGDITTRDMSTFLFPNTFLFSGNTANCCIIGFHSYDFEFGDASNGNTEKRYVVDYSSWISPGIFGGGFQDVTALSHEISEIYNDPFVASDGIHNVTPWWKSPNGNCQNDLEVGDVIEGLANGVFPITMPNGATYHPQNEALVQWFAFQSPSSAINGAYSYPNTATLKNLSAVQNANCK